MTKKVDILIVGQGIAGTCLAFELLKQGKTVLLVDNFHKNCSSIVAAGLVNPIVFKRLTKSWNADKLLPAMYSFFESLEKQLNEKLVYKTEILKLFTSIQEQNQWIEKSDIPGFEPYLGEALSQKEVEKLYDIDAPFGGGLVKNSCYVDLPTFLKKSRIHFKQKDSFLEDEFDYNSLDIDSKQYKEISFDKMVFCEGHRTIENPWFNNLPFNFAKGEVIEFKHKSLTLDRIINKNGFVLPTAYGTFKLGATYEWKELNEQITEKGKKDLLEKIVFLKNKEVEVVNHLAGIRPTVKDRRPLFGKHKSNEYMYVFNGLGTKGALIAPYYAQQMSNFIVNGVELESDVDIKRISDFQ